jgi:hypothetical protein
MNPIIFAATSPEGRRNVFKGREFFLRGGTNKIF